MRIWSLARAVLSVSLTTFTIACGGGGTSNTPPPSSGGGGGTTPPPASVSVSVDPASASVIITQTQQFKATVTGATDTTVTWTVNGIAGGDANVGTITSDGIYTAPAKVPSTAQFKVTATSKADTTKTADSGMTVLPYTGVLTYHTNNARDGQNLTEKILTQSNVNSTQFGKLFTYPVDGMVFAQPLYVSHVSIGGNIHNVVYIVTEHDTVSAFDADKSGAALWSKSFIDATQNITTIPSTDLNTPVKPEIGITSTPVIDGNTGTMYVVAGTKENGAHMHRLHALDIATGAEKFGGPVQIAGTFAGTGDGNVGGQITFQSILQLQRSALLLSNGVIYIAFASHNDLGAYHGWVMGYDASSLQQKYIWNTTPNGNKGGIWMAGCGPSADSNGNIYVVIGNGSFSANTGGKNYGDSVVKLTPGASSLTVADYFTPYNQADLVTGDIDLGSSGFVLLADQPSGKTHIGVTAGKGGTIYLINRDDMGKFNDADDSQIVQAIPNALGTTANGRNLSTAVLWQDNTFYTGRNDFAKQYKVSNGALVTPPFQQATHQYGFSATSAMSADGTNNGILWTIEGGANVLHAYDATNISTELYNTTQAGTRDSVGNTIRFNVPMVAGGKVYVAGDVQVTVLGLLP
ncbi:MAG TPA: hypothetical protein VLK33_13400 [Terriglobales bacterium]|nr:hypothetical protein [Terriglobales bacterium]